MPIIDHILKPEVRNGKVSYTLDLTWPCIGLMLILGLLKLALFEGMSWWVVTAPIWFLPAVIIAIVGILFGVVGFLFLWAFITGGPRPKWKFTWKRPGR